MKTKYKHIQFVAMHTVWPTWECRAIKDNTALGLVHWYPAWQQYCFSPASNTIFSTCCLKDIQHFIAEQL